MLLRREQPPDVPAVRAVHRAAFDTAVEADLLDALRDGGHLVLSLVVLHEGEVAGHVALSSATLGGRPSLGLGPVGVLPQLQGRGLGAALLHAALGAAEALDAPEVVLLGDPALYGRFGFVAASSLGVLSPEPSWGRYFQVRPLTAWDPASVGPFRYAPPFEAL